MIVRKIVGGVLWSAVESWCRQAILFVILVVLARHLGPEPFGLAALALIAPIILAVPVTQGLPEALIQRPDIDPMHLDSVFWFLTMAGVAISGVLWICAGLIATAFGEPQLEALIQWTSIIVVLQAVAAVPTAVLKRQLNFRLLAVRTMVGTTVGGVLGITLAIGGFGVWSLVGMQVAKALCESAVLLFLSTWRPRLRYSFAHCRQLFGFAGPITVQSLWTFVNDELPKVVIGMFLGTPAVGIYTFARRPLELLIHAFVAPLTAVAMPAAARLQTRPDQINQFFNVSVRTAGIVGFPAFIGFAAIAPDAVPFIFGEQWGIAVTAVQLLMMLGLLRTIDTLCALTLLALGHSSLILKLNIAYTVLAAVSLPIAAQISLEASIATLIACNLVLVPIFLDCARRIASIDVLQPLGVYWRLATASIMMLAVITALQMTIPGSVSALTAIAIEVSLGGLMYVIAASVLLRTDLLTARDTLLKMLNHKPAGVPS